MSAGMVAEKNSVCRFAGMRGDDLPDRMDEAHVEHPVGFVEDEDFEIAEPDGALGHQVEQPAGGGDQDVDAAGAMVRICGPMPTPPNTVVRVSGRWRP